MVGQHKNTFQDVETMYNPLKCRPDYWRTMEPATGRSSTMINDDPIKTYINIYIYGAFNWMVLNHDEWWWRSDQKIEKCLRLVFSDHDCYIGYDFCQPQPWRWHSSHLGSCLKIQNCPKVQNRTWISESKHKIGCDRALKKNHSILSSGQRAPPSPRFPIQSSPHSDWAPKFFAFENKLRQKIGWCTKSLWCIWNPKVGAFSSKRSSGNQSLEKI